MRLYLFIVCLVFRASTVASQPSIILAKIDSLIHLGMDSMAFPGAQLYISVNGQVIVDTAYGYHTYDREVKVLHDDLYDLASITKVSTGLPILMKMYGQGDLNLDAPLGDYFPLLVKSNKSNLTLRTVLAHQGGLNPYIVFWQEAKKKNGKWRAKSFKTRRNKRFSIPITEHLFLHRSYKSTIYNKVAESDLRPERKYLYSGLLFLMLPDFLERTLHEPMEDFLYREIYQPIGLDHLTYRPHEKFPLRQIVPTEMDTFFRHQLVHGTVHDEAAAMLDGISCNAGLFGNANDLGKLFEMYMNYGYSNGVQLIDSSSIKEFTRYQFPENDNRRGLGFDKPPFVNDPAASYMSIRASSSSFGHSGFTGTFVWADPEVKMVVVLLTNRVYPSRANAKLYQLNIRPMIHDLSYDVANYFLPVNN
jgi:CubicO group peptidase (beta-lactamase class C family)